MGSMLRWYSVLRSVPLLRRFSLRRWGSVPRCAVAIAVGVMLW
jgi:hypothetical protein